MRALSRLFILLLIVCLYCRLACAETVIELWRGGGFSGPSSVSVNAYDGSCWVADTGNNQVVHLSAAGTELWRGGGFSFLGQVSVNPTDGSCWVADSGNDQVVHLSSAGLQLWRGGNFVWPRQISVNPTDGSCWVADTGNGEVVHLSSAGLELWRGGGFLLLMASVSVNPTDGSCWVSDFDFFNRRITRLSSAGEELWQREGRAGQLSVNPTDGSCWVADPGNDQVGHLSPAGQVLWLGWQFHDPVSVSVNPTDGSCWVADGWDDGVVHLSSAGLELWRGGSMLGPSSVSVDPTDDSCWVADTDHNEVVHLGVVGAHFRASPWAGPAPLEVDFVNLSVTTPTAPATAWDWDFGDGGSSTEQSPSHQYTKVGTYTVTLTMDCATGSDTDTKEHYVHVSFPDVPADHWGMHEILACVDAGIVGGYPDGSYKPDVAVTREQMAIYVSRGLAGGDEYVPTGPEQPSFPDVAPDNICYKYIEYAYAKEIVFGYPTGEYRPAYQVDRGQMAVFVARAIATPTGEPGMVGYTPPSTPTFPDVTPDPLDRYRACHKYVEYIAEQGVTYGYPDGLYHPERIVSRGLMAIYVARAFQLPM